MVTTTLRTPARAEKWKPIADSGELISTGSRDFDAILGGGFPRGAYFVVEIAADVQISEIRLITRSIMLNFINQGRGVVILPTGGVEGKSIKAAMRPYTTDEAFDSYVRIQEPVPAWETKESERSLPPYMVPVSWLGSRGGEGVDASTASFEAAYRVPEGADRRPADPQEHRVRQPGVQLRAGSPRRC